MTRTRRTTATMIVFAVALLVAVFYLVDKPVDSASGTASAGGVFAADSPFNTVIDAATPVDRNSEAMVSSLIGGGVHAGLIEFAIPIYEADDFTPRYSVDCQEPASWGTCPLAGLRVPIPDGAQPQSGSDGAMVIIDRARGKVYEFWQAAFDGTTWTTSWGSVSDLAGDGWSSTATGSGASRLGGVIRVAELKAGVIPHALVVASSNACAEILRPPATKTDGTSTRGDCVPEGSRLRLDPTLDIAAITNLTPAERAIAVALQTYGAYVIDTGGAEMSMSFERAPDATDTGTGVDYTAAGLGWDYYSMTGIPWTKLQVLSSWDGA